MDDFIKEVGEDVFLGLVDIATTSSMYAFFQYAQQVIPNYCDESSFTLQLLGYRSLQMKLIAWSKNKL